MCVCVGGGGGGLEFFAEFCSYLELECTYCMCGGFLRVQLSSAVQANLAHFHTASLVLPTPVFSAVPLAISLPQQPTGWLAAGWLCCHGACSAVSPQHPTNIQTI